MFEFKEINVNSSKELEIVKSIYESSFPINERRDFDKVLDLIINPLFSISVVVFDNIVTGFLSSWDFSEFTYIEHFAISIDYRGIGIGSEMLQNFISKKSSKIILEVEYPIDKLSFDRIKFYERFGFEICREDYIQPPYDNSKQAVPMILMSKPEILNFNEFQIIKNSLHKFVYGVKLDI